MAVVITTLKIIGIILLSVIALVLVLTALILFVPIRYRIRGDKKTPADDIRARISVSYLLHMISGRFSYDGETDRRVCLFGFRIWPKREKKKRTDEIKEETENVAEEDGPQTDDAQPDEEEDFTIDWNVADSYDNTFSEVKTDSWADDEVKTESFADKIDRIAKSLTDRYESYSSRIEGIRKKAHYWEKMYNDTRNRAAFSRISDETIKLLKKIAPKKIKGFVHFGSDDPAVTGRILMYLAMIYPVMPRKLTIDPGFEDTDIYGNIDIKGRLALISVAVALGRLYFDKDCRRLWRLYRRKDKYC